MQKTKTITLSRVHETTLVAFFSAVAITTSTAIIFIPNVETMTFIIFLSGYLFGKKTGLKVAWVSSFGFEIIASSLMGGFNLIIFFFKIIAYSFIGYSGYLGAKWEIQKSWEFIPFGIFFAILYDFLTTVGFTLTYLSLGVDVFLFNLVYSLTLGFFPFTLFHIIGGAVLFSAIPKVASSIRLAISDLSIEETIELGSLDPLTIT
ncbi:MAG: hypothetical protein KAR35_03140 [Candidatus Heimdallarchaeota archaeon]|nr:hypothetical protein [Candidatus Heimdallarchaeota archaeon]MCK5048351.1 hypothetical protein [Candidatus Heimdallarchaeota archaeon]